jgi:hypothetical protein
VLANSIRVTVHLMSTADTDESNPWMITQWLRPKSAPMASSIFESEFNLAPPASLYALWHNSLTSTAGTGGFRAALPTGVKWYYTEIAARLATTDGDADHVTTFTPAASGFGGSRSGTVLAQPLAVVAQKRTTTGSRRRWGRNYLPCLQADIALDGRSEPASTAAIVTALDVIWGASWVRDSVYDRAVIGSDGLGRNIGSTSIGTYAGVQRRRLR